MKSKKFTLRLIVVFLLAQLTALIVPVSVLAIPPPEILKIGSQIFQTVAFLLVFLSVFIIAFFSKVKKLLKYIMAAKLWVKIFLLVLIFSFAGVGIFYIRREVNRVNKINRSLTRRENKAPQRDFDRGFDSEEESALQKFGEKKLLQNAQIFREETLKEANRKYGISAKEANSLANSKGGEYQFIDVRETVEYQQGHIPGFRHIRYADLLYTQMYNFLVKKKKYIFFCHSGERGWKVAAFFKNKGFNARFVIGGLRRWLKKGYNWQGSTLFPPVPQFENKDNFLSTDEVKSLYQNKEIVLVDLRKGALFKKNHLPQAINIPLMYLPSKKIDSYIKKISKNKGVVTVGYDRLSSYYSEILGYMLVKKGYTFTGRYQFPEEFKL